jgi:hypothetical protein
MPHNDGFVKSHFCTSSFASEPCLAISLLAFYGCNYTKALLQFDERQMTL